MRFARELPSGAQRIPPTVVVISLGLVAVIASAVTIVGSDTLWLPALGSRIRDNWTIPSGIPFAAASSGDWVNTTVLGQLVFSGAYSAGSIGVVVAQALAVLCTLLALARDALRRGARPTMTSLVIIAVSVGAAASLFITRAQMLSLLPFGLLLVLLRRQHERPTAGIWWAALLIALWGNLHGAVLVGEAVLGCYLLFSRLRRTPTTAVAVGAASLAATCLNPGLLSAPRYYLGVVSGAATDDESGMWSRLSLSNPFDVLLIVVAVVLAVAALRRRAALWEWAAGVGLLVATLSAARHGVWLLLFLAVPAALGASLRQKDPLGMSNTAQAIPGGVGVAMILVSAAVLSLRAPYFHASDAASALIARTAHQQVVLAPEPLAESLAAEGATVWASNPLDAFEPSDQRSYLAFLRGDAAGARRALEGSELVVAEQGSAQFHLALKSGYREVGSTGRFIVLRRK
ncbi:hypothetical protein GCM10009817_37740 [Terrabacter lapilli]|uniref:Dolichyl-phosphate-mannose-protein mannosyltransferase n=1 Tax=Terrabacter lapilli TaxID=436231 RepID=A0ABP5E775_9MICO